MSLATRSDVRKNSLRSLYEFSKPVSATHCHRHLSRCVTTECSRSNLSFKVTLALLGSESLAHAERDAALVQSLVGGDGDADFITNTQQQQPTLSTVDCHLPDELVCHTVTDGLTRREARNIPIHGKQLYSSRFDFVIRLNSLIKMNACTSL